MGRIILGIILLVFLLYNAYGILDAALLPGKHIRSTTTVQQGNFIYTKSIGDMLPHIAGIFADMLLVMIINFMDMGYRQITSKRKKKK